MLITTEPTVPCDVPVNTQKRAPSNYHALSLSERASILGASVTFQLCRSVLAENRACSAADNTDRIDAKNLLNCGTVRKQYRHQSIMLGNSCLASNSPKRIGHIIILFSFSQTRKQWRAVTGCQQKCRCTLRFARFDCTHCFGWTISLLPNQTSCGWMMGIPI